MTEIRSFLLAAAGTFGLLEVVNSELYQATASEPEHLLSKALITLIAGVISTVITRLLKHRKCKKLSSKRKRKSINLKKK